MGALGGEVMPQSLEKLIASKPGKAELFLSDLRKNLKLKQEVFVVPRQTFSLVFLSVYSDLNNQKAAVKELELELSIIQILCQKHGLNMEKWTITPVSLNDQDREVIKNTNSHSGLLTAQYEMQVTIQVPYPKMMVKPKPGDRPPFYHQSSEKSTDRIDIDQEINAWIDPDWPEDVQRAIALLTTHLSYLLRFPFSINTYAPNDRNESRFITDKIRMYQALQVLYDPTDVEFKLFDMRMARLALWPKTKHPWHIHVVVKGNDYSLLSETPELVQEGFDESIVGYSSSRFWWKLIQNYKSYPETVEVADFILIMDIIILI